MAGRDIVNNNNSKKKIGTLNENIKKMKNIFSTKVAKNIIKELQDPRLSKKQKDGSHIKNMIIKNFDKMEIFENDSKQQNLNECYDEALKNLENFIKTKDEITFVDNWSRVGKKLNKLYPLEKF